MKEEDYGQLIGIQDKETLDLLKKNEVMEKYLTKGASINTQLLQVIIIQNDILIRLIKER